MRFTKVPEELFSEMQLNAGVILNTFNPDQPGSMEEMIADIVGATTGGVNFTATPTFSDAGEGIDNCPVNMKELKKLDSWEITMSGTYVSVDANIVKSLIGAADVAGNKITPRADLKKEDFKDIWWVGDYSDKNGDLNGGYIAIHMMSALNTGGFQLQSSDKGKGNMAFTYTAHYSIEDQSTVPFEVYVQAGSDETAAAAVANNEG